MIYFFTPSRIVGGAERQMALLIKLALELDKKVCVIDSEIGIVKSMVTQYCPSEDVQYITWSPRARITIENSIIICQGSYLFNIGTMIKLKNCDVRFWFMHPISLPHMYLVNHLEKYSILAKILRFSGRRYYARRIQKISSHLFFQSNDTRESINRFYGLNNKNPQTLLLNDYEIKPRSKDIKCQENQKFCWIGRLDRTRRILVKKLIDDFKIFNADNPKATLNIIGDGSERLFLEEYVKTLQIDKSVIFDGMVDYSSLNSAIEHYVVIFAQGTSIYEGIKASVPVAVLDFYTDSGLLPEHPYWFYGTTSDLTLGYTVNQVSEIPGQANASFYKIVTEVTKSDIRFNLIEAQSKKLITKQKKGERACAPLILNERISNDNCRTTSVLDWAFLKIRAIFLRLKNIRILR